MKASRLWIGFVALVLAGCSPTTNLLNPSSPRFLSQRTIPDLLAAVMVGDGISGHAVEPGHRRIGPADGVDPVESADECLLQNVFRHIA